jgi:hypothetical protein
LRRDKAGWVVVGSVFLIAGCDGRAPWRSAEQRINDAVPVGAAVLDARSRLEQSPGADEFAPRTLEVEYQNRLRLRALTCAQGSEPSLLESSTALRNRLPAACFEKADAELLQWLRLRRMQRLLGAPALRAIPATPPQLISAAQAIAVIRLAAAAGIAVVSSGKSVEVIDIGNDQSLYHNPDLPGNALEVSPNGRMFALGGPAGVVVRDATTGDELVSFPEHTRFAWLDSTSALLHRKNGGGLELLDIGSSQLQTVKGVNGSSAVVIPFPSDPTRFVVGEYGSLSVFRLQRGTDGLRFSLVDQQSGSGLSWTETLLAVTSDGRRLVQTNRSDLWITDLQTLKAELVAMPGIYLSSITALPDPDKVLVLVQIRGAQPAHRHVVYSLSRRVFMMVPDGVTSGAHLGGPVFPTVHLPSIDRVGVVNGKSVRLLHDLPAGLSYGVQAFGHYVQEMGGQSQQRARSAEAARLGYKVVDAVNSVPVIDPPFAQLAKDARIEAVGVYEPAGSSTGAGPMAKRRKMPITVVVRPSNTPIVLCLSSYEAVSWRLSVLPGAKLKAVLLSGYEESTVEGAGSAPVQTMGREYAYESGKTAQLQREVLRWTGKPISAFQGKYTGSSFEVGGW